MRDERIDRADPTPHPKRPERRIVIAIAVVLAVIVVRYLAGFVAEDGESDALEAREPHAERDAGRESSDDRTSEHADSTFAIGAPTSPSASLATDVAEPDETSAIVAIHLDVGDLEWTLADVRLAALPTPDERRPHGDEAMDVLFQCDPEGYRQYAYLPEVKVRPVLSVPVRSPTRDIYVRIEREGPLFVTASIRDLIVNGRTIEARFNERTDVTLEVRSAPLVFGCVVDSSNQPIADTSVRIASLIEWPSGVPLPTVDPTPTHRSRKRNLKGTAICSIAAWSVETDVFSGGFSTTMPHTGLVAIEVRTPDGFLRRIFDLDDADASIGPLVLRPEPLDLRRATLRFVDIQGRSWNDRSFVVTDPDPRRRDLIDYAMQKTDREGRIAITDLDLNSLYHFRPAGIECEELVVDMRDGSLYVVPFDLGGPLPKEREGSLPSKATSIAPWR